MSRGFLIFGINNESIDYVKLAMICSGMIKKNMSLDTKVCLVSDKESIASSKYKKYDLQKYFDDIVILEDYKIVSDTKSNLRRYKDTAYHQFDAQFKNTTRASAYALSPYDETILIDSDYLITNSSLDIVWGSADDVMINNKAKNLHHELLDGQEFRLNQFGIKMYWATLIYFRKSEKAKLLFDLVEHVKENWDYYEMLYELPGKLFRNDYAFSIAIHILNAFVEDQGAVVSFPHDTIMTATDFDQLYKVVDSKTLQFFVNDKVEQWKFYVSKLDGINVHCMNKISILRHADNFFRSFDE